ncbi:MAG: hypothetical protein ABIS45_01585 [Burkholderiales bacterium]
MSNSELSAIVALLCAQYGTVKSVTIHRRPLPYAIIEMSKIEETVGLAGRFDRTIFGNSVLLHWEQLKQLP